MTSIAGLAILASAVNLLSAFVAFATLRDLCGDLYPHEAALLLFDRGRSDPGGASAGDWMGCGQQRAVAWGVGALRDRVPLAAAAFSRDRVDLPRGLRRAGFPMLPVVEPDGRSTGRQATLYCLALLPVSLAPTLVGMTGAVYFAARAGALAALPGTDADVRPDAEGARCEAAVLRLHHLPAAAVGADDRRPGLIRARWCLP